MIKNGLNVFLVLANLPLFSIGPFNFTVLVFILIVLF